MKHLKTFATICLMLVLTACGGGTPSSDSIANAAQEKSLKDGVASVGAPAIVNWREKRLLKTIYELRDQEGLTTYTYMVLPNGQKMLICTSFGYPLNDAIGFTSPDKIVRNGVDVFGTVTQAEPNGLFTPDFSNAYWVLCLNPKSGKAEPIFMATQPIVSPFML